VLEARAGAPGMPRSDWPSNEFSTAVGANVAKDVRDAVGAERALVAADHGVWRVGRQVYVAQFTVGAQVEHWVVLGQ
jgi:hypothetical protein